MASILQKQSGARSAAIVAGIVLAATGLSVLSYQSSIAASDQILALASDEARSTAEIQANTLSVALANKIESVSDNLEIIVGAKMVQDQNIEGAKPLFDATQASTSDITSGYSWLDKEGRILWAVTFSNPETYAKFAGSDFSYREYYIQPKETMRPHYSTVIESIDGVPRLTISYPIITKELGGSSIFKGVVASGIEVNTLGKYVESNLKSDYKSNTGLLDRNGLILYSSSSPQYVGKNIFDPEIQSVLPEDIKSSFNQFVRDSLAGNTGSGDFSSGDSTSTVAYQPVTINGSVFAILYIVTPHELAGTAVALVEQQRTINLATVASIGAVAAGISTVVLVWNRRLSAIVATKTSQLIFSNNSLEESNRLLQISNTKLIDTNEQLAKSNEQLRIHDKLQKEFVNVAAHELRTPIQPLLGAAELLELQFNGSEEIKVTKPEIDMIVRNAKRLERLSSDILQISRIDSGALKLNKETFSLAYIISEAIKDAKAQSIFDPTKLGIIYSPDDIFVNADSEKLRQVITNLLTNAIKFTNEGKIFIITDRESDNNAARVSIKDTGSGIDPEVMARLFEKFVTKSDKGTGIGLYICKKIIDAHSGRISGYNNPDGVGATFEFTVPIANDDKPYPTAPSVPENDTLM
jgi:signal transduction histidine kinase